VFIFDERVDMLTLVGSAIIIGTGLYTFLREHNIEIERRRSGELA
ncbi:MAG: drug/metabolite transporter (DMT)-like permease, partial [Gammaproteobacteria bacterium]